MSLVMEATITCPVCSHRKTETMPENACVHRWACPACGTVVAPHAGDCCVFCSHADTKCPPKQQESLARQA